MRDTDTRRFAAKLGLEEKKVKSYIQIMGRGNLKICMEYGA